MELTIAFFTTGAVVLVFTSWRFGRFRTHFEFARNLCDEYQCNDIDLSGDAFYTDCISHRWTLDNIVRKKRSRLEHRFQDLFFYNTLTTAIWFMLFMGIGILVFGVIIVRSIEIAGNVLIIFLIGIFAILGSGEAKTSEDLLSMLQSHKIEELSKQDYAYVTIALDSIKKGLILSFMVGSILVVFSPWGELAPVLSAQIVATFTQYLIWNPAVFLSEFSMPLSIIYLMAVWPAFSIVIIYTMRKVRRSEEEKDHQASQI